jgi:hypothetical protein
VTLGLKKEVLDKENFAFVGGVILSSSDVCSWRVVLRPLSFDADTQHQQWGTVLSSSLLLCCVIMVVGGGLAFSGPGLRRTSSFTPQVVLLQKQMLYPKKHFPFDLH